MAVYIHNNVCSVQIKRNKTDQSVYGFKDGVQKDRYVDNRN